jgi:hypothetical protein
VQEGINVTFGILDLLDGCVDAGRVGHITGQVGGLAAQLLDDLQRLQGGGRTLDTEQSPFHLYRGRFFTILCKTGDQCFL